MSLSSRVIGQDILADDQVTQAAVKCVVGVHQKLHSDFSQSRDEHFPRKEILWFKKRNKVSTRSRFVRCAAARGQGRHGSGCGEAWCPPVLRTSSSAHRLLEALEDAVVEARQYHDK